MGLLGSSAEAQSFTTRPAVAHGPAGPALRHPQRLRDDDGAGDDGRRTDLRRIHRRRRAGRRQDDQGHRPEPAARQRRRDRRSRQGGHAGLHRHPPPPGLDGDQKLHSRRHPDRRRHGNGERGAELRQSTFWAGLHQHCRASPATTGRRTSTSASCSAGSRSSTPASRRCSTSRRSITRGSTPMRPYRR